MASICPKYFGCLSDDELIRQVIELITLQDEDGNDYINTCYTDRGDCDDYSMAFDCLQDNIKLSDIVELVIVADACGRPALNLLGNICQTCVDAGNGIPGGPPK